MEVVDYILFVAIVFGLPIGLLVFAAVAAVRSYNRSDDEARENDTAYSEKI